MSDKIDVTKIEATQFTVRQLSEMDRKIDTVIFPSKIEIVVGDQVVTIQVSVRKTA